MDTSISPDTLTPPLVDCVRSPPQRTSLAAAGEARLEIAVLDIVQICLLGYTAALAMELPIQPVQTVLLVLAAASVATGARHGLRSAMAARGPGPHPFSAAVAVLIAVGVVAACAVPLTSSTSPLVVWLLVWALASATVSALLRLGWLWLQPGRFRTRVAIIGPGFPTLTVGRDLGAALESDRCQLCLQAADTWEGIEAVRRSALGGEINAVVLAVPPIDQSRLYALRVLLAELPVQLCLALPGLSGIQLVELSRNPHAGAGGALKRVFDVILAGAALAILAPLLGLVAIGILLESPGPALFRQQRSGIGSKPFEVLKFRTMRTDLGDISGERHTLTRDPRVTRFGRVLRRTSLDELPQLLNVLRGEMSLVGPRPHPLSMRVAGIPYTEAVETYRVRHRVRPGITGWAQINGSRGEVDTVAKALRRVQLDLWYVDHWSLVLDLKILLRTLLGGFISLRAD